MHSVLLVEDDLQLAKIVKRILEAKDFIVTMCEDGAEALKLINSKDYDLYLIDINIPSVNGLELVKYIRELKKDGYIVMITASVEEYNFKKAYEYGCDDYIKKPFHATELEVRIEHLLGDDKSIKFDDYEFIPETFDLFKNGERINLRKKEKKLLYILLKNMNLTVNNQKIIDYVWGENAKSNPPLRQLVNELRKKFDKDYIKTVVGVGYRFETED
jgi:DNA-binding response OmpR family regulator